MDSESKIVDQLQAVRRQDHLNATTNRRKYRPRTLPECTRMLMEFRLLDEDDSLGRAASSRLSRTRDWTPSPDSTAGTLRS